MNAARPEPVDVPVIRQSFRCFWFGLVGLIPGVGFLLAWQALGLFDGVAKVSGDRFRSDFPLALFFVFAAVTPILHLGLGWPGSIVVIVLFAFSICVWSLRQFFVESAQRWNPARHWAWAGAACARVGLAAPIFLLMALGAVAYGNLIFGLPPR